MSSRALNSASNRSSNGFSTYSSAEPQSILSQKLAGTRRLRRPRSYLQRPNDVSSARPRPLTSTTAAIDLQQIVCAVTESRGIAPTVGLAFVNLDTAEAALCQLSDTQTYVRTLHKISVFAPSTLLLPSSVINPESKLFSIIKENLSDLDCDVEFVDRRCFAESTGHEFVERLGYPDDLEGIQSSIDGNYFSLCCLSAALRYSETHLGLTFSPHTLRIRYEPSEGTMMIDISTVRSLELIQNLRSAKSRDCLFGILNSTMTVMGSRLLRSNILQPLTDANILEERYDAVSELSIKQDIFFSSREGMRSMLHLSVDTSDSQRALKGIPDVERVLATFVVEQGHRDLNSVEQDVNRVIAIKEFVSRINPIYTALSNASSNFLKNIRKLCDPTISVPIESLIQEYINDDVKYAKSPLDLRNQRVYAVRAGVKPLLDIARVTYKEAMSDAYAHLQELNTSTELDFDLRFESGRQYFLRIPSADIERRKLPDFIINVIRRRNWIECSTLELSKLNQKINNSHQEVLIMSNEAIVTLLSNLRGHIANLYKGCEGIAMLDVLAAFAHASITNGYIRPQFSNVLAVQSCRHPIKERIQTTKFVPNDVYATQNSRFQIITGSNMSGKSTYIRSIALVNVMAQIGCFVPASFASFPIVHQLFARTNTDDSIEGNVSTFAAEMREAAFILHNVDRRSLVIVDELGRGTSTHDGLAIAIAIAEALINSRALVWFATHYRDLGRIFSERNGIVSLHLAVDVQKRQNAPLQPDSVPEASAESQITTITMKYSIVQGYVGTRHYGLEFARLVSLPPKVIQRAEEVAQKLQQNSTRHQETRASTLVAEKRKLVLALTEQLEHALSGTLQGDVLRSWLKKLQTDFVARLSMLNGARSP